MKHGITLIGSTATLALLLTVGLASAQSTGQPASKPPVATPVDEKKDAKPAGQPAKEGEGPKLEASSMSGLVKMPPAATPVPREDAWWKQRHEGFNARVKEAAQKGDAKLLFIGDSITQGWEGEGKAAWESTFAKHVVFLDIGASLTEADGTLDKKIMPDFLHLSPEGYARWATAIEPTLGELLK